MARKPHPHIVAQLTERQRAIAATAAGSDSRRCEPSAPSLTELRSGMPPMPSGVSQGLVRGEPGPIPIDGDRHRRQP